jgi:hypothetical protein
LGPHGQIRVVSGSAVQRLTAAGQGGAGCDAAASSGMPERRPRMEAVALWRRPMAAGGVWGALPGVALVWELVGSRTVVVPGWCRMAVVSFFVCEGNDEAGGR